MINSTLKDLNAQAGRLYSLETHPSLANNSPHASDIMEEAQKIRARLAVMLPDPQRDALMHVAACRANLRALKRSLRSRSTLSVYDAPLIPKAKSALRAAELDPDYQAILASKRADAGLPRLPWAARLARWEPTLRANANRYAYDPVSGSLVNTDRLTLITSHAVVWDRRPVPREIVSAYLHLGAPMAYRIRDKTLPEPARYAWANLAPVPVRLAPCAVPGTLPADPAREARMRGDTLTPPDALAQLGKARHAGHRAFLIGAEVWMLDNDDRPVKLNPA
jgi:hypothetical protein